MMKERAEDMAKREREPDKNRRPLGRVPFRRKINLLVVLPTVAMIGLLTPVTVHEVDQAREWSSAADFLAKTKPISLLVQDLSVEREQAQAALRTQGADPLAIKSYLAAIAKTDAQALVVSSAFGADPPPAVTAALADIDSLSYVRTKTPYLSYDMRDPKTWRAAFGETQNLVNLNYGTVVTGLVASMGLSEKGSDGGSAANLETELAALYQGDLAENQREAALAAFAATQDESAALLEYTTAERNTETALDELGYVQSFPPSTVQNQVLTQLLSNPSARNFQGYQDSINNALLGQFGVDHTAKQANDLTVALAALRTPAKIQQTTYDFVNLSEQRAGVEAQMTDLIIQLAQHNSSQARYTAAALLGACLATFLLLLLISFLIRNSIVRPVVRLTEAATHVAHAAAADLERVTDEDTGQHSPMPVFSPLPVLTGDEIGDLARAFNQVQETALLVLERQVTIRRNTAEMFGNVGRRIHNLTGRQLSIIDQVERTETDPVLLDRLYRIDHLAVRLQRGADSLILLSGEREANLSGAPMRLTDVVRSAVGRVEGYQRAVLIAEDDAMVTPSAVSDLTLMIAELVENAVAFSPASSRVEIAVGLTARGFVVEIVDRGMGMTPDQLAAENARLVRRERLDLAPTRVLGLFVVGRLSVRTGAAVELAPTPGGGTTARIFVPGFLLAGPSQDPLPQRTPQSEIAAAQPFAAEAAGSMDVRTPPALGRYSDPAENGSRRPDPAASASDLFGSPAGGGGGGRRRARSVPEGSETPIPRQPAGPQHPRPDIEGLPQRRPRENGAGLSPLPVPMSDLPPASLPSVSGPGGLSAAAPGGLSGAASMSPVPQPGPPPFAQQQPAPQQPPYGPPSGSPISVTPPPSQQPPYGPPPSGSPISSGLLPPQPSPSQEAYSPAYPDPPRDPTMITAPPGATTQPMPVVPPMPSAVVPQPGDAALPRRTRTATPQPAWPPSGSLSAAPEPAPQQDAVAVRDALEDYEAGVERALQDSAENLPTRRRSGARHAGPSAGGGEDAVPPNDTRRTTP
jgi:signal transduction histidine kinase